MNVRETISEKPRIGLAAAGGLVLIGIIVIYLEVRSHPSVGAPSSQFYFTVDDGKTWFADAATNVPPFDKDGQQAVRAHVYRSPGGIKFVAYLERFKPNAQRALEASSSLAPDRSVGPGDVSAQQSAYIGGREVKRPGDKIWVSTTNLQAAAEVMVVRCPDGSSGQGAVTLNP
jgi:hypothetical protein